jgi:hypothetical protein
MVSTKHQSVLVCHWFVLLHRNKHNIFFFLFLFGERAAHVKLFADVFTPANTTLLDMSLAFLGFDCSLSFLLSLDEAVAFGEFSTDSLLTGKLSLHPGVANDISHRETLVGQKLKHVCNKVLKFFREKVLGLSVRVSLPEKVSPVSSEKLVVRIAPFSMVEWRVTCVKDEKNDTESEQVDYVALVGNTLVNLRSHVALSAEHSFEETSTIATFNRCRKSEVSNLDVVIFIEHNVLGLKIAMASAL